MNRQPRDRPANHEQPLDALLESARALDPKLDELSTARIEGRLSSQLAEHRQRRYQNPRRWAALAASLAAALALFWLGRASLTPQAAPAGPLPSARQAASSVTTGTASATATPTAARADLLTVYCIAGADAESEATRSLLGRPVSHIELSRAAVLRAALGAHTRLSLQGPGTLSVASALLGHSLIELDEGQLIADFEGDGTRRLSVQTPHVRVDVVGTRFAIDVRAERSVIHVEHGTVQVQLGARSVRVSDGETFDSRERAVRRESPPPVLLRMLRDHALALLPPPAGEQRVLSVESAGAGLRARLGDALLGPTPVAALVPLGEVAVTLEPDPAARHARTNTGPASPSARAGGQSGKGGADALYAAAENCMRLGKPACARARLARLIESFGQSPEAATARYELARLVQDAEGCRAAAPLWSDYLRLHLTGYFAATAREQLARCQRDGSTR